MNPEPSPRGHTVGRRGPTVTIPRFRHRCAGACRAAVPILLLAVVCSPLVGQGLFQDAENAYLAGHSDRAVDLYGEALRRWVATDSSKRDTPESNAEAELAIQALARFSFQHGRAESFLDVIASLSSSTAGISPPLAGLARFHHGRSLYATSGDLAKAHEAWAPLGFLDLWHIVGPFDNERGGGFEEAYGPEKGIHLDARYDGKVREISWRKLPARPVAGFVDLDPILAPNEECLAYGLTFVRSQRDQMLALRIGSDEGFRAWVNGNLIGSQDVQRSRHFDQATLPLPLRKGWNNILLKVAEQKGSWGFTARITALDGKPADGWSEAPPDDDALAAAAGQTAGAETIETDADLDEGVIGPLTKVAEARPDAARVHYLLGKLLRLRDAHDSSKHPDSDALRRAIEIDEKPAAYHFELARSFEKGSDIAAQRDDNDWRHAMEAAAERGCALASFELAGYYRSTFRNTTRARAHVERALAVSPDFVDAILLRGRLDAARGFPGAIRRAEDEATRLAPESPRTLRTKTNRLAAAGRRQQHLDGVRKIYALDRSNTAVAFELVGLLLQHDRRDEARALLSKTAHARPFRTGASEYHARLAFGEDDFAGAAKHLGEALLVRPEAHELHEQLGVVYLEMDDRSGALAALERSLELQPNQPELRERLEFLRAQKSLFEEEFRRDAKAIAAAAHAESYNNSAGDPARVLLELIAVEVNPDGTHREYSQQVVQVLNDAGVTRWDRFQAVYAAGEQVLEFKAGRVYHADGSSEESRLPRYRGSSDGEAVWRRGSVDLPPLVAGDIVEVAYVREEIVQGFFGDYFGRRETFRGSLPIAEKVFTLRVPSDREFHFHQRHIETKPERTEDEEKEQITHTWVMRNVPKLDSEPSMPPGKEILPIVEVSTFKNWNAFNSWYWNLIRKQFESSPELDKKVAELTSGKDTELEKIRALYNFVVTDIRYNAWEFGVHGFKPYNASKVFARRFGDCKDKATLLSVMMERVGIQAHPVLIYADQRRGTEDLKLPMVNHFNHCITYVPSGEGRPELFLDGTASFHSVEELPSMDRGAKVLIVREEGALVKDVPWNTPSDLSLDEEWEAELHADLSASIHVRLRARGDFAVSLRRSFEIEAQRRETLEKILSSRFAGAVIEDESFSDLTNLDESVSVSVTFRAPKFATPSPEGLSLSIPEDFFRSSSSFSVLGSLEKRQTDIILSNPRRSSLRVVFRLPEGRRVKSLPDPLEVTTPFGRMKLAAKKVQSGDVVVERLVEITAPRVPLADYDKFRELATSIDLAAKEKVVLEN